MIFYPEHQLTSSSLEQHDLDTLLVAQPGAHLALFLPRVEIAIEVVAVFQVQRIVCRHRGGEFIHSGTLETRLIQRLGNIVYRKGVDAFDQGSRLPRHGDGAPLTQHALGQPD